MLKLDYDTREISFNDLKNCKTISYLKKELSEKNKNQFLFNVYNNQIGLTNNIILIEDEEEFYIVKGLEKIELLKDFYEDKIKIDFINGNNIKNPYFSELKSSDKRKFKNCDRFRVVIVYKDIKDNTEEVIRTIYNSI